MGFKNKTSEQLRTYDQVKDLDEYAGVLADETILVDFDEPEQAEIMLRIVTDLQLPCRIHNTTRGKHFLMKNSRIDKGGTKVTLACGLQSDIKVGRNNSLCILKYNQEERKVIYDILDDEEYSDVPWWMTPIKTTKEFWTMSEGDGRNQELFNYILTLQANGFGKDDAKQCIEIINNYVMSEPLPANELETVLRDKAFQKPIFFQKNTFLFDKFAHYLKSEYNIIKIDSQLHIYRDGVYIADGIENLMIKEIPNLSKKQRTEVLAYLDVLITDSQRTAPAVYIAFKNGIYNVDTDELEGFDPSKVITNKIDHDFVRSAYFEPADKVLDKMSCYDPQIRSLLEEVIGYTFFRRNELRKAFLLKGNKSNGKSTFLDMIKTLLGEDNVCALDLKELGDRFRTVQLFGKLCNIGDDIDGEYISNTAIFKKMVSGDPVTCERKNQNPFSFSSYAKLLFSANYIPRMGRGKDSAAVLDRLVIVPFDARFSADDPDFDPYIKYKLRTEECMQYLINIGIEGLKRVLKNRRFTVNEKVEQELVEFEESNNPILLFFKEVEDDLLHKTTKSCYQKYDEFCIENNFQKCSHIEFSKQVKAHYHYDIAFKKINGKTQRVFVKEGEE